LDVPAVQSGGRLQQQNSRADSGAWSRFRGGLGSLTPWEGPLVFPVVPMPNKQTLTYEIPLISRGSATVTLPENFSIGDLELIELWAVRFKTNLANPRPVPVSLT
jgi:hypothetical protein